MVSTHEEKYKEDEYPSLFSCKPSSPTVKKSAAFDRRLIVNYP